MKCLTIVTAMSGHGGHNFARKIAEHDPEYRWYDHPKNNIDHPNRFPELDLAPNHFRKRFSDNTVFPHLFDRIESFLSDKEKYYSLIINEIKNLSKGKRLIYVCHEPPNNIKSRFPKSKVIQILPTESLLEEVIERHMNTHMLYPVQSKLHQLPGRSEILNDFYWSQTNWAKENIFRNSLINFRSDYYKKSLEQIINEEKQLQRDLYIQQVNSRGSADVSLMLDTINEAVENIRYG